MKFDNDDDSQRQSWLRAEEGMNLATDAEERVGEDWNRRAFDAIRYFATLGEEFNADDVYDLVGRPKFPCAAGGVFKRAVAAKIVTAVGWREARGTQRHGAPARVYVGAPETGWAPEAA